MLPLLKKHLYSAGGNSPRKNAYSNRPTNRGNLKWGGNLKGFDDMYIPLSRAIRSNTPISTTHECSKKGRDVLHISAC